MSKKLHSKKLIALAVAATVIASTTVHAEPTRVVVSIENLAPANGTNQTPHWVGFHDGVFDIYNGGTPADTLPIAGSVAVERLAEDGNNAPISQDFNLLVTDGVDGNIAGPSGPIRPGETGVGSFVVDSQSPNNRYFSYGSMVLPSNDFWYANGNPLAHPIFDAAGNFIAEDFIVAQGDILDAGTEVNTEIPAETAFFGQAAPNTGQDENGVIRDFDPNDPLTFFKRPGSGGVLDDARFRMADFLLENYPLVKIGFASAPAIVENLHFNSFLWSGFEVPPVASNAYGYSSYKLREKGTTLKFNNWTTLSARKIVAAHLHLGGEGENGPVVASLFTDENRAERVKSTRYHWIRSNITGAIQTGDLSGPLAGQPLDALVAEIKSGNIYINIHTKQHPGGEIRGQLNLKY